MTLFRKRPAPLSEEERQAAAVDLKRIQEGGVPLGAEERLKRVANASSPFFTSDLSVNEYAIAEAAGLKPIAQVMGSSVVQHGWQNYGWSYQSGVIEEIPVLAEPWNLSRRRAFDRVRQEAEFAAADAVIAIEMESKGFLEDPRNVEYVVFGTAVRDPELPRRSGSGVRMSALSGQDIDKLRRIGAETLGVIGHTSVVCVYSDVMMGGWWGNQELTEVTAGVYEARRLAMGEVLRQARRLDANDMVISTLTHQIHHHEWERAGYTHHVFIVSMHVLGTAIRLGAHEPHPAPLAEPVMSINLGA